MKKRMYRLLGLMIAASMVFGIAGCSSKPKTEDKKDEISQSVSEEEPEKDDLSADEEEPSEAEKENEKAEDEDVVEVPEGGSSEAEVNAQVSEENEAVEGEEEAPENSASVGEVFPGPDIVELVNLRGDETTAYKLADGRYMDRQDTVYIFDGVDTWTQDGTQIEWNEKVK